MITLVSWTLVGVCAFFTGTRAKPAIKHGINVPIFLSGAALTLCYFLVTPQVYGPLSAALPNIPDLVSRLAMFTAFALLGLQLARSTNSKTAEHWVVRWPGRIAYGLACAGEIVAFAFVKSPHPSPLVDLHGQPWIVVATGIFMAYLTYVGLSVIAPIYRNMLAAPTRGQRTSWALIFTGLLALPVRLALVFISIPDPAPFYMAEDITMFVPPFLVVAGLLVARLNRLGTLKLAPPQSSLSVD